MSLLMQALKKAERAKQNHLVEDELAKPSEEFDQVLSLAPQEPLAPPDPVSAPAPAAKADAGPGLSLESYDNPALSLSPLPEEPIMAPSAAASSPLPEPAPTPESAPAQPARPSARSATATATAAAAAATPAGGAAIAAGEASAAASSVPPRPRARPADTDRGAKSRAAQGRAPARRPPGIDAQTLRLGVLIGIAVLIAAAFGIWYWLAVSAPGAGSRLPMVPMPPPNATPADNGGMIIAAPAADVGATAAAPGSAAPALAPATAPSAAANPAAPQAAAATAPAAAATATQAPLSPTQQTSAAVHAPSSPQLSPDTIAAMARFGGPPPPAVPSVGPGSAQEAARQRALAGADPQLHAYAPPGAAPASAASPRPQGQPAVQAPPATVIENGDIRLQRTDRGAMVNPALQGAYAAFNAGDLGSARQYYLSVQRSDPNNRDVLLGLAAIALRENQPGQAASNYLRLLELDPNDGEAVSGLIGLRHGDPEQSETRLKAILQRSPEAGPVLFALGNLVAQQGRWSEAQQIYFRAYSANPGNADYAFNVAVGLDRLNQPRLAIGYYQRALALATNNPGSFDRDAAHRRLRELSAAVQTRQAGPGPASAPAAPQPTAQP